MNKAVHSIVNFGRVIAPDMFTAPSCGMHYDIDDDLRDPYKERINIVAPRGHAKSSIGCEIHALWHIFASDRYLYEIGYHDSPETKPHYVVIISKTQREAKQRLETIKGILGHEGKYSERFRSIFGNYGEDTAPQWTNEAIKLKNGSAIRALGTGQPIRGAKSGFNRPDLIIIDDPEDEENTRTAEAMLKNLRWLEQAVVQALTKTARRKVVVIGTPINPECMVVKLHEATGWHSAWYKINPEDNTHEKYSEADKEFHLYEGVIWKEVASQSWLLSEKERLSSMNLLSSFYRENCCHIIGDEDQQFKPEYERYYEGELRWDAVGNPYMHITHVSQQGNHTLVKLDRPQDIPVGVSLACDPSASMASHADKTAIVPIAYDHQDNIWVLPYVHGRFHMHELIDRLLEMYRQYKPHRAVIEVSNSFRWLVDELWRLHRVRFMSEKPTQAKKAGRMESQDHSRIGSMQPKFSAGKVFLQQGMTDLVSQLRMYPTGKDDVPDAMELALRYRSKPRSTEIIRGLPTLNDDPYDHKSSYDPSRTGRYRKKKTFDPMLA